MAAGPGEARPSGAASRSMRGNRCKDTRPELALRRALHALGYRFRLHRKGLPGTPDLVFPSRGVAVQVHGCFWHAHAGCPGASVPRSRPEYWGPKLARNAERDRESSRALRLMGWRVCVVWECELRPGGPGVARAAAALGPPGRVGREAPCGAWEYYGAEE